MVHLVLEQGDGEFEVDLRLLHPDATVGDLTELVQPDDPGPRGILVDGARHGPEVALAELGLVHGACLRATDGQDHLTAPARSPGLNLVVIGGPDAGRALPLVTDHPLVVGRSVPADLVVADPTASSAHARLTAAPDGVEVTDLGSTNGTFVDGVRVTDKAVAAPGSLVQVGATQLRLRHLNTDDRPVGLSAAGASGAGTIAFNRPPRAAAPDHVASRPVPDPPAEARRAQGVGLVAMVVGPLLMGGVMVAIYKDIRFAAFMLLSPVLGIGNWISSRRQARKEHVSSSREHRAAVVALDQDLRADATSEVAVRELLLPDMAEVLRRATQPSTALWQRRPDHPDWLRLRAGLGAVPWSPLELDPRHARHDLDELVALHDRLLTCPVEVDLSAGGVVGIVGDRAGSLALARSLVCQAATHHGPADLPMALVTTAVHSADWDWAKWLPHLRASDGTGRLVSDDPGSSNALLASLGAALGAVDQARAPAGPALLLVLDDPSLLQGRRSPARDLLRSGARGAGIVLAPNEDQLPAMCTTVITTVAAVGEIEVRQPHLGQRVESVTTNGLQEPTARTCARALARFEDPELGIEGGGLPSLVRLLPILGVDDVTAEAIGAGWSVLPADPAPATPLGVGEDGVAVIDLVTDGPHALIGGTTGSGKSELLRSMVAGMAARVDPDHLVFVLVDYKGGSAFDECARLPHTVGMVTDLDESLGERALQSLEAELHHRERVLREAGAQDLPAYLAVDSPAGPLPRLVVVIDEFATLANELPDFLGALVGIAQRGRSLGVHLILATQRPQGAVNANIKANTNLRIALRVQDAGDSDDIIDQDSAADLSRSTPGRAYIRRGPGEVELVQTALSTAAATAGPTRPIEMVPFLFSATDAPIAVSKDDGEDAPSDLHRLVEAIRGAFEASLAAAPRQPWLPALPDRLVLDDLAPPDEPLATPTGSDLGLVTLALLDDPKRQRQVPTGWDTAEGHLAVFGMVGSGTTSTLLAVARSIAQTHRPDDAHLYALDFGTGDLTPLAGLPHCGGVVGAADHEGQARLVRRLRAELDRRRLLAPAERTEQPTVIVLVDGIGAFLAEHDGVEGAEVLDGFTRLVNEGPSAGICFVLAADRPGGLPHRLAAAVTQRILLRLSDPMEYSAVGVRLKEAPRFPPGRGYRHDGSLVQVADPEAVTAWSPLPGAGPPDLRPFPALVTSAELRAEGSTGQVGASGGVVRLPVGLDEDHATVHLTLHGGEHALVAGSPRSGVSSALVHLAAELHVVHQTGAIDFVVAAVATDRSPLAASPHLDVVGPAEGFAEVIDAAVNDDRPWFFLIDDAPRIDDVDGTIADMLTARPDLHVIAGGRTHDLHASLGHWTRRVARNRIGILLQPDLSIDGDLVGVRLPRRISVALRPGRGFVVGDGELQLAQLAHPEPLIDG